MDNAVAVAAMKFFGYVVWWARRFGVPSRDAEDVAQLVMMAVLPGWTSFVPWGGQLEGVARRRWLVGVAARQAKNYHKRRASSETPMTNEEMAEHGVTRTATGPTAEDLLIGHEDAAGTAAEVALTELAKGTTRERWAVFAAHKVDGLPMRAIAALEGIPIGTAYNHLRLARLDLRAAIKRKRAVQTRRERFEELQKSGTTITPSKG